MAGIEINGICKAYEKPVLRGVSFSLPYGGDYCLMGPSGCGKTTLLRILMGLESPDSGTFSGLLGHAAAPVFQEDRLCENLSVNANIRMAARGRLLTGEIEAALDALALPGALHRPARLLSGGMKRRVALARALLCGGDIWIFDEPFKGLDGDTRRQVMRCISERKGGRTLLWVTHDAEEPAHLGSTLLHLPALT